MEIVSKYVREQQRYTKNNLKSIFDMDETMVEKFIRNLKTFGVLKSVKNSDNQFEISDLVDDDIEISDETAVSEGCLYVFTYVGVIICGSKVIKAYPKYLVREKKDYFFEMRQVIKVLERYNRSDEQMISMFNGAGENRSFNLLAVILYLLNDYFEYGVYTNSEDVVEINGDGEILWEKTIDESFALIEGNRPYYMELYAGRTVDDDMDYFKRLHECILTECSSQLHQAQLEDLFGIDTVSISEESLDNFGEKEYILERISKELNIQFNTHRQILLKTLYAYVAQDRRMFDDNDGICMYGTTAYHAVWEKICAEVFDNKLHTSLGQLKLHVPLAERFQNQKKKELIDIIEKPIWEGADTIQTAKDTLIPDLISILSVDEIDYFVIFDAKYYLLELEKGKSLRGNPGVGDITKQYLYQLAYRDFIKAHNIAVVKNCFLMPTENDKIVKKGTVRMPMLEALNLENIQIRQLPAAVMYEYYLTRRKMDIRLLDL